ncbi:uncharacterized protein LOC127808431 [Diospyros lotus]|uniref:uncharacterized protein LOC127808431 n=1 Tax=Diospyros lotus TaxID=55363 RepID=UPI00224E3B43|nr:uncharacterized protein LOC127808431 [Diospyros lotus]
MENDDDYQSFSPPEEPSPPIYPRKLKRLKKATKVSNEPPPETEYPDIPMPLVDPFKSQRLEFPDSEELGEPLRSQLPSTEGFDVEDGLNSGSSRLHFGVDREETKRALDFNDGTDGFWERSEQNSGNKEVLSDLKMGGSEKKRLDGAESIGSNEKKKKRAKSLGDDAKPRITSSSNKRRETKERRTYLQQLHVESQRLLRETRDATFKPLPIVQKPISLVLEKIRQRKLEMLKKTASLNSIFSNDESNDSLKEGVLLHHSETETREVENFTEVMQEEATECHMEVENNVDACHKSESKEAGAQSSHRDTPCHKGTLPRIISQALDEQTMHSFRPPVNNTQDLFDDSQTSQDNDKMSNDQNDCPLEEVLAPSILAMKLKFDSAPCDDIYSDEEDNDKENTDPSLDKADNGCSSQNGDPVKAFVDEEAEEEDDSDNDLLRFQENEEEDDIESFEEFNDLIATECEEKPVDNEKRTELHQKWLEQQDAVGTENLLQRLKYGSKLRDTTLVAEEEEDDEDEEDFSDEAAEDPVKTNVVRLNSRIAKQMIPQMFSDKNEGYLSSDGEETEKRLLKERLLGKAEEQGKLLSPVEDENSREVFGLIKKLNTFPDAKKKEKTSSYFDKMLRGRKNIYSSKSSFLGRAPSHSLPSSYKQGASAVRSFVFGRDDSNSRSSISLSEDSSDVISRENRPTRNGTAKFSSSQSKRSAQSSESKSAAETSTGTSLFEILKRSSVQSNGCNQEGLVGLTQTVFAAFKVPKKPIKIEGRN